MCVVRCMCVVRVLGSHVLYVLCSLSVAYVQYVLCDVCVVGVVCVVWVVCVV